jgi:hypothetical protein
MNRTGLIVLLPLLAAMPVAQAAVVSAAQVALLPATAEQAAGAAFSIEVFLDAADAPGSRPGLFGGEIIIDFDPQLLTYSGFTPQGPVTLFSAPVVGASGARQTVRLGFENAPELGVIGSFQFIAIGPAGSLATIGLADADDFLGSFISYVPTQQPFYPLFHGASVAIVPVPAAAWLLGSALGLLACWRRQSLAARPGRVPAAG